ncbi:MAG: VOC family protein [Clostridiales bacterium]|nr:VOC family protein [Clostridiales bacterium]
MRILLRTVVIDCKDEEETAEFYSKLLGWQRTLDEDGWILMRDPMGGAGLSFQREEAYEPPVWPEQADRQAKMLHLDFLVDDLKAAAAHALACGAQLSKDQFFDGVRVFFDPAGHPFCLFEDKNYEWDRER